MKKIYLKPEEIYSSVEPLVISTVLGSCISLCIWDRRLKTGGMNHFVLPYGSDEETRLHPNRYATHAIPNLLRLLKSQGSDPRDLVIKMLGGSSVTKLDRQGTNVADGNIEAAERILRTFGLDISMRHVGGKPGRKVEFCTSTGEVRLQSIRSSAPLPSAIAVRSTLIAIGASTGGTSAIKEILMQLPAMMPPILIVQHIPGDFSAAFAEHLNTHCALSVKEAADGDRIMPGFVYVAPGGRQMKVKGDPHGLCIRITNDPPENSFKPSVDYFFRSLLDLRGLHRVAVLLTGMGADGANVLKSLKSRGAFTIVQDEATSVVFGMPKAAIELDAAELVLPLGKIAAAILKASQQRSRPKMRTGT